MTGQLVAVRVLGPDHEAQVRRRCRGLLVASADPAWLWVDVQAAGDTHDEVARLVSTVAPMAVVLTAAPSRRVLRVWRQGRAALEAVVAEEYVRVPDFADLEPVCRDLGAAFDVPANAVLAALRGGGSVQERWTGLLTALEVPTPPGWGPTTPPGLALAHVDSAALVEREPLLPEPQPVSDRARLAFLGSVLVVVACLVALAVFSEARALPFLAGAGCVALYQGVRMAWAAARRPRGRD